MFNGLDSQCTTEQISVAGQRRMGPCMRSKPTASSTPEQLVAPSTVILPSKCTQDYFHHSCSHHNPDGAFWKTPGEFIGKLRPGLQF